MDHLMNSLEHILGCHKTELFSFMLEARRAAQHLNIDVSKLRCFLEVPVEVSSEVAAFDLFGISCKAYTQWRPTIECTIRWDHEGKEYTIDKVWYT